LDYLGLQRLGDGSESAIQELNGSAGSLAANTSFIYPYQTISDYKIDTLIPTEGTSYLTDQSGAARGVFYDSGMYRTITVSPFFGSFKDGDYPSTKSSLMARYLSWLTDNNNPDLLTSAESFDLGVNFINNSQSADLVLQNVGLSTLNISDISISGNAFILEGATSASLDFGDFMELEILFNAIAPGIFTEEITIISNDPEETTYVIGIYAQCTEPPVIGSPDIQYNFVADTNQELTDVLTINNSGNYQLEYSVEFMEELESLPVVSSPVYPGYNRQKDEPDIRGGYKGSGGPDNYGHEWIDSNEENGPIFNYDDISLTGIELTDWIPASSYDALDEGYSGPIDIGFSFMFYENQYNQFYVSSNGFITFSPVTTTTFANQELPDPLAPNDLIAPFWTDLDGSDDGSVYCQSFTDRIVIQFTNWGYYGSSETVTFQLHLMRNSDIFMYYIDMNGDTSYAVTGIENENGSDGLLVAFNEPYVTDGLALKISAGISWIEAGNYSGIILPGQTESIPLHLNTLGLDHGVYHAVISVFSNDPLHNQTTFPVILTVTDEESYTVTMDISADNSSFVEGALVSLLNQDGDEDHAYYQTVPAGGSLIIDYLITGSYSLEIDCEGFDLYQQNLVIDDDLTLEIILNQTSVNEDNLEAYVARINNYPNPFNPTGMNRSSGTTITFFLNKKAGISLVLYNIKGQKVKELLNSSMEAGEHNIVWNGTDNYGDVIANGIYLYSLQINGKQNIVRKCLVVK